MFRHLFPLLIEQYWREYFTYFFPREEKLLIHLVTAWSSLGLISLVGSFDVILKPEPRLTLSLSLSPWGEVQKAFCPSFLPLYFLSLSVSYSFSSNSHPYSIQSVQFSSVAQSCLTLCNPINRSTPGLPVHHQLLELTQTHIHRVGDAIQPPHPLSSPSPPAPNPSQHQSLFQWVNSSHQVAKVLEFQL